MTQLEVACVGVYALDPTVILDWRGQAQSSKATATADEITHWAGSMKTFFELPLADKPTKLVREPVRGASLAWMRALDNQLRIGVQRRLHNFVPDFTELELLVSEGTMITIDHLQRLAPVLSLSLDRGPNQYAPMWFLQYDQSCNVVPTWDPDAHGSWNVYQQSARDCKCMQAVYKGQLYFNYRVGPYNSMRWSKTLVRAVDELISLLQPDDGLLLTLWPRICCERGWTSPDETGREARENFIKGLSFSKCVKTFGEFVAWSRWYSLVHRERQERDEWTTHCLPLIYYCICSGFLSRRYQLFKTALERAGVEDIVRGAKEELAAVILAEGAAASSSDAPLPAAKKKETLDAMRKRCFNTMHVAMEVGADSDLRDCLRAMGSFGNPLSREHGRAMQEMKTPDGIRAKALLWSTWGWLAPLHEVVGLLFDLETLRDCNLVVDIGSDRWSDISAEDAAVTDDDARAQFILDFAVSLIKNRCKVMVQYSTLYPWRMGAFLDADKGRRDKAAADLNFTVEHYHAALEATHPQAKKFMRRSTLSTASMRVVAMLSKQSPLVASEALVEYAADMVCGFGSSCIIENAGQACRDAEDRGQASRTVKRARRWAIPRQMKIAKKWGHAEVEIHTTVPVLRNVPVGYFEATEDSIKTEKLKLARITETATWPTARPDVTFVLVAEQSALQLCSMKKNWHLLDTIWQSALLPEKEILYHGPSKRYMLTLAVAADVGVFTWPVEACARVPGRFTLGKADSLKVTHVTKLEEWSVVPTRAAGPLHLRALVKKPPFVWGVSCLQVGDAVPLLHWQATRGFAHVPEVIVKRLLSEYFKVDAIATPFLEQSPDAEAAATLLAISCVAPKLTATDAERILYQKTELEGGEDPTGVQAMMDEEVLTECMVARDVAQTKDWLATAIKKHAAKHDQKNT